MIDTPHIAGVAHLVGDSTRSAMLMALKHDRCLSAMTLARIARVAPSTASGHLAMLVRGGLVDCDPSGRHRYYRLAGPEVAAALEAMETLVVAAMPLDRLGPPADSSFRFARLCYDHLAGRLGVELAAGLIDKGHIISDRFDFRVTRKGRAFLGGLGVDLETLESQPRLFTRKCPDWSEHRPHIGGALGAAILGCLLDRQWLRMRKDSRTIQVTSRGCRELADCLGMACED